MDTKDLSGLVREAVGAGCRVAAVDRLRGGSKKGVYRVRLDGARTGSVIVYSWADAENYWPGAGQTDPVDPFAPASGLVPFLAAQRILEGLEVRVPRVLLADDSQRRYPADVAVVEDIPRGTLEALLDTDPARAAGTLRDLAEMLGVMHQQQAPHYGRVDMPERAGATATPEVSCERRVLDRALRDLDEAARRDGRIATAGAALRDRLRDLAGRVNPRAEYGLIHGELGPDHVLVDTDGLMYFDVEWEHVFLRLRFGERYAALARPDLDPRRLGLYTLATRLSLVAGPLRLLDGDFPDVAHGIPGRG